MEKRCAMSQEKQRSYTAEFKREAVRLVTEQGYKITEAARNLGIHANLLGRWKRELQRQGQGAFPGKAHLPPEQEELCRLHEENRRLKMERDILKKAVTFFAKESS